MQNYNDINALFCENDRTRIILKLDDEHLDKEKTVDRIKWIEVNCKGRVTNTGETFTIIEYDNFGKKRRRYEKGDTLKGTYIDLKSIEVGKCPILTHNGQVFTKLNYKVNAIKPS